jgi:hypothetical protein
MALLYDLEEFDRHHCLKPPWVLVVAIAFLSRDFLLPVADAATKLVGSGSLDLSWVYEMRVPYWYVVELPAIALLYAWIRRTPGGGNAARWIWHSGRWLLLASAVVQLYPFLGLLNPDVRLHLTDELVVAAICAAIVLYLATSRRVRDVFADFPAPDESR